MSSEDEILRVFQTWDINGDGIIQPEELKTVLRILEPGRWGPDTFDELLKAAGASADGCISYKEFVAWAMADGAKAVHELGMLVAPHQFSSTVIKASASSVYQLVKPLTFKWMHSVSSVRKDEDETTFNVAYADHTIQKIHLLEWSDIELKVMWEVLASEPPAPTGSAVHTITCRPVTSTGECFMIWNTDFSSDCTLAVLEDSKWKKLDAFAQLQDFLGTPAPA